MTRGFPADGFSLKLIFLGTRGNIDARTRRHRRHTALLVAYRGRRVLVDCGADWLERLAALRPRAVVLTHAHPDHAGGLAHGAPCPVYATADAWRTIKDFPLAKRRQVTPRRPFRVAGIRFEAFTVEHSLNCPAVGYRIRAGRALLFYVPDVVYIHEREEALAGVQLYVGDGATPSVPLVRRRGERLIGHTPVRTQLGWCARAGVPRAIITHCGTAIVTGDERRLGRRFHAWGQERGVEVEIATDSRVLIL